MKELRAFKLPVHTDDRGDLVVAELSDYVDWKVERIYFVTNVTADRGGHVVKGEKKIYACQKGSLTARFFDGDKWQEFKMSGPADAILMEGDYYREFCDFSEDAVLMAISSLKYDSKKYIYDLDEYINYIKS